LLAHICFHYFYIFISIIAILHDIGAVEAQKKYGSIDGVYQEKEGPEVAKEILKKVGYNKNIDRICFIIGNHHTPSKIDGLDFQILKIQVGRE
jgi:HD superfamily phosphodiesterase